MIKRMGIVNDLRKLAALTRGVASPWGDTSALAPVTASGVDIPRVMDRDSALSVPAIMRARNLICATAARMSVIAHRDGIDLEDQPAFLTRTDGALSPYHRMLWTMDDLLMYGWSLWSVTRDYNGHVLTADRVSFDRWSFNTDGTVLVDGLPAPVNEVILIPGIHGGILAHGANTIFEAISLAKGVIKAVENPSAYIELHQKSNAPMTPEEVQHLKAEWVKARKGENGGVAFSNSAIEVIERGAPREHIMTEGRNTVAVDIARLCGIPAPMIDATLGGTSLSYSNTASRMAELIAFGIAPMIAAVVARLGMDDVVPRGVALRVDTTEAVETLRSLQIPDESFKEEVIPDNG